MKLSLHERGEERRKNRRVHIELPVTVAVQSGRIGFPSRRPRLHGTVRHASITGLELLTDSAIPVGAVVRLWIRLINDPEASTLKLRGDVVWSKTGDTNGPCLAGIHLRDRPRAQTKRWTNLVAERIRRHDS